MVRVGLVGVGFMGWIHYLAYRAGGAATLAAVASRDPKKRSGDWRGIQGNFGPPGEQVDLSGVAQYAELDELLADPNIDLVDLCLPPHLHADATVRAFAAGKHVFCEKPMALTAAECDRMVEAGKKAGKQLLIGQILPLFPEYAFVRAAAADGRYGRLLGGSFKRLISDPLWLADFYDPAKVGGPMIDLHVHDAHFIRLLCGMPRAVCSQGRMRGEVVEHFHSLFYFDDKNLSVHATSGVLQQQGRAFTHGFEVLFERATLLYDFAVIGGEGKLLMPLTVLTADGKVESPSLGSGDPVDAFKLEIAEVARCVERNEPSALLSGDLARDALVLCQKQTESVRSGKIVAVTD